MTPERYKQYLALLDKYLSSDMTGGILAEKQAEVIVSMGDALEAVNLVLVEVLKELEVTKQDLRLTKVKLVTIKKKFAPYTKQTSKQVKAGVLAGLKAVSLNDGLKQGLTGYAPQTPEPSPLLVP
jgi:hypothetical protein